MVNPYNKGSAFSCCVSQECNGQEGMSLRDYFAAHALTGLLTNATYAENQEEKIARDAVLLADALLKKLEAPHAP